MAKDKEFEKQYKLEGQKRISIRKQKRLQKFNDNRKRRYPDDGYCCPNCGLGTYYCSFQMFGYTYICPDCNTEFETEDV